MTASLTPVIGGNAGLRNVAAPLGVLGYVVGRYYGPGYPFGGGTVIQFAHAPDEFRAWPFYALAQVHVDRLLVFPTANASAGGKSRWGLYTDRNMTPDKLIVDGGEVDMTAVAGIPQEKVVDVVIGAGTVVWLAYNTNNVITSPDLQTVQNYASPLGWNGTSQIIYGKSGTLTYGALPATAPAMNLLQTQGCPIWMRTV